MINKKITSATRDPEKDEFVAVKEIQRRPGAAVSKKGAKVRIWGYDGMKKN